ncbi:extracellular matrix protein 1 [Rhinichthys klamathensis goyatoka]|uniref:extracellular matrix protein 1 n=1 Tax=Rhinichthys klamathensis goyatoka TaxID=3034132 RepID=UPI0024B4AB0B|nr:extracellular matrix protein 1 [Rhinichthys klamathensis goyatoka]
MSSSRGVGLYLTLLLALLCEASEDPTLPVQREVTDIVVDEADFLQKELPLSPEELDFLMMQRPIIPDLSKVMVADSLDVTQREATNFHPENVPIGHQVFRPRSMGPLDGPDVDFPPSFPNAGNLKDICQFSKAPVRYQKDMLPSTGFGYAVRQAEAVNQLQSWYSVCCGINGSQEVKTCCAEQAWKKSLSAYCTQEFSIKTSHYFCCKKNGKARWSCFDKEASDSSYHVSSEVSNVKTPQKIRGFKFNSRTCKGSLVASPRAPRKQPKVLDFNFPPGRPDSSNIEQICTHHKIRPRYFTKCLPCTGYGWLVRQSKAINLLEREYNQCCQEKKGERHCAEKKWKKMVDKFCKDEKKTKGPKFECCGEKKGEEQYSCFASAAPDPGYNSTDRDLDTAVAPATLHDLCDTHTAIKSMKGFPFSVDEMVERCCPLVLQERPACIEAELDSQMNDMCKTEELVKPHCCEATIKDRAKCATKLLLRYIGKANQVKYSGRKKCPLIIQFQPLL